MKEDKHSQEDIPLIDQVLIKYGYGKITWFSLIALFFTLFIEGIELCLFGAFLIPLTKYYSFTDLDIKTISSSMFISIGMGSFFSGYISERFGRISTIKVLLFLIIVMHIVMSLTETALLFAVFRVILGLFLGAIVPLQFNICAEYLPIRLRSFTLTSIWIAWNVGQVLECMVIYSTMPQLEHDKLKPCLYILGCFEIFGLIVNLFLLKDSPRNLLLHGESQEAFEILTAMNEGVLDTQTLEKIKTEVCSGCNENIKGDLKDAFSPQLLLTTILLIFIWLLNALVTYGLFLVYTLTLKGLKLENPLSNHEIIVKQIESSLITLPSCLVAGALSEISWLGRKKAMMIGNMVAIIFLFLCVSSSSQISIWFGISLIFIGIAYNIVGTYGSEVYPTRIRDMAVGVLFCAARVGGVVSQIFFVMLNNINIFAPYYFSIVASFACVIFILLLPRETYNSPLDRDNAMIEEKKREMREEDEPLKKIE